MFLGLDAGGTRTRVALVDERGQCVGSGEAGCSLPRAVGFERARFAVTNAVERAWGDAQLTPRALAGVGAGFAGAGDEAARTQARSLCERALDLIPGARLLVDHDLGIAYRGSFGTGDGVVVVSGTGSAAYARDRDGAEVRVGGFGPYADDAGSGFDLGRRALSAALRALDGRLRPTRLVEACVRGLALSDEQDLVDLLRRGALLRASVASLAPSVCALAREGDGAANRILDDGAEELAHLAATAARRANRATASVACCGGLFQDATFVDAFRRRLAAADERLSCRRPALSAELGAAWWCSTDGEDSATAQARFDTLAAQ